MSGLQHPTVRPSWLAAIQAMDCHMTQVQYHPPVARLHWNRASCSWLTNTLTRVIRSLMATLWLCIIPAQCVRTGSQCDSSYPTPEAISRAHQDKVLSKVLLGLLRTAGRS